MKIRITTPRIFPKWPLVHVTAQLSAQRHFLPYSLSLAIFSLWQVCSVNLAQSQTPETSIHVPKICSGYRSENNSWGYYHLAGKGHHDCPVNSGIFGVLKAQGDHPDGQTIPALGTCCQLPADDILGKETTTTYEVCPKDFVITGATDAVGLIARQRTAAHCTKINTVRYQLGEIRKGIAYGLLPPFYPERHVIKRIEIPAAVRFGISRLTKYRFHNEGCMGSPVGSLLVGKLSKRCKGYLYRQLQYAGLPGDPPKGTPVVMFPDCRDISSIFDENPTCIKWGEEQEVR